jgi:HK97 gp10 family phage protein
MSAGFGFDIDVEGGDTIEGLFLALKKLPLHLTDEVHIAALKKAAEPVKFRLIYTTPELTGEFVKTLRIAKSKFKVFGQHQVIVGFKKGRENGEPLAGFIAHFLEYGTEKMAARPFMRPADEKTKAEQESIYTAQLQIEVDKRIDGL